MNVCVAHVLPIPLTISERERPHGDRGEARLRKLYDVQAI
jgi:hypothetical protein